MPRVRSRGWHDYEQPGADCYVIIELRGLRQQSERQPCPAVRRTLVFVHASPSIQDDGRRRIAVGLAVIHGFGSNPRKRTVASSRFRVPAAINYAASASARSRYCDLPLKACLRCRNRRFQQRYFSFLICDLRLTAALFCRSNLKSQIKKSAQLR
jgi:hypothetical protein